MLNMQQINLEIGMLDGINKVINSTIHILEEGHSSWGPDGALAALSDASTTLSKQIEHLKRVTQNYED